MILHILRALFVLLMAAVAWSFVRDPKTFGTDAWMIVASPVVIAVLLVCADILAPRKKLSVFSGAFFGLVVGILIAYALSYVTPLVLDQVEYFIGESLAGLRDPLTRYINLLIGATTSYLAISFVLQTKDDFRFIIP